MHLKQSAAREFQESHESGHGVARQNEDGFAADLTETHGTTGPHIDGPRPHGSHGIELRLAEIEFAVAGSARQKKHIAALEQFGDLLSDDFGAVLHRDGFDLAVHPFEHGLKHDAVAVVGLKAASSLPVVKSDTRTRG